MKSFKQYLKESAANGSKIYVVRHGRTMLDDAGISDGRMDWPLSDQGKLGLIRPTHHLKEEPIHTIYAPDLRRTSETAHLLSSGILTKPKIVHDNTALTWNLGKVAGEKKKITRPMVEMLMKNPDMTPPQGESYSQFRQRFLPFFGERQQESIDKGPLVLVLSGSNIREVSHHLTGDHRQLDLTEAGLISLEYSNGHWVPKLEFGAKDDGDENLS